MRGDTERFWEVHHWDFLEHQWEPIGTFDTYEEAKAHLKSCADESSWPVWRLVRTVKVVWLEWKTRKII